MKFPSDDFFGIFNISIFELFFKKISHKNSRHIKSFLAIMISIILICLSQEGIEQSSGHISNKVSFSSKAIKIGPNMRYNFFHKDIFSIFYLSIKISNTSNFLDKSSKKSKTLVLFIEGDLLNRIP